MYRTFYSSIETLVKSYDVLDFDPLPSSLISYSCYHFFRLCHDCSSVGLNNLEGSHDVLHSVNWIDNAAGNLGAIFTCYLLIHCCKMY